MDWAGALLDPDRDDARQLFVDELGANYRLEPTLLERAQAWLAEALDFNLGGDFSANFFAIAGALIVVAVIVAIVWGLRRRASYAAASDDASKSVLGNERLRPAEYRKRAAQAMANGDYSAALLDGFRALTAQADEDTLLEHAVALTAAEVVRSLQSPYPQHRQGVELAGRTFDLTRYGEVIPTADDAQQVLDLDAALQTARPQLQAIP